MNCKKKLCSALLAMLSLPVLAQEEEITLSYPQLFFGAQGGAQVTLTDYNNRALFTPTASLSFGSFFTPVIGTRLHVGGIWNKGGYSSEAEDFRYDYKYLTTDVDLLINLVTLFGKKNYYPVNVYLLGGVGLNYAWDNDEAYERKDVLQLAYDGGSFGHNARIGTLFSCDISKHVSIILEFNANCLKDRYNSKLSNKGDWQLAGMLGVAYKFAAKRQKKLDTSPQSAIYADPSAIGVGTETAAATTNVALDGTSGEVWENRVDTVWYDDVEEVSKPESSTKTWNIFYGIGKSDFSADAQLAAIGAFLKERHDCKVEVKSYADARTGDAAKNMELSKKRMEQAVKALVSAGVPASSITSSYHGDTIQPFAENDKNRVTIVVATGLKGEKNTRTVKKFRTKTVRYRVK